MEYLGVVALFGGLFLFNKVLVWYFEPYFIKYGMIKYHITEGEDVCIIGEFMFLLISPVITFVLMVMILFFLPIFIIVYDVRSKSFFRGFFRYAKLSLLSYHEKKNERVKKINKTSS